MYWLYSAAGFSGIYLFVLVMSGLIAAVLFKNIIKENNPMILSFIMAMLFMYLSKDVLAARNQIFSFLIFELEINCLIGLLEQGKKRCFWYLIVLAFLLVLVHDTLYILFFVMAMPYFADAIISKIFQVEKLHKFQDSHLKNIKYLVILLVLCVPIGFCTPVFASTYTNLINCMSGFSTEFIEELKPISIIENVFILTITFLVFGLMGFTKAKFKIKDVLFVLGFLVFALLARRNVFFLYLIGSIYLTNMLKDCMDTYVGEEKVKQFWEMIQNSKIVIVTIFCFISIISIRLWVLNLARSYVNEVRFPVEATDWILNNVEYENAKIWTSFNWGSYLELQGIKVFVDSRSGMYTEEENEGVTVLKDWYQVTEGVSDYQEIFEKYQITHCLVEKGEKLNQKLEEDANYTKVYEDSIFALYEKEGV